MESDRAHSERLALHQIAISDIEFFKQQQWRVTNYALLLYAAFLTVPTLLPSRASTGEFATLAILALLVLLASLFVLGDLEVTLRMSRDRVARLRKTFDLGVLADMAPDGNPKSAMPKASEKTTLIWLFRAVTVVGFIVVAWLLYRQACAT